MDFKPTFTPMTPEPLTHRNLRTGMVIVKNGIPSTPSEVRYGYITSVDMSVTSNYFDSRSIKVRQDDDGPLFLENYGIDLDEGSWNVVGEGNVEVMYEESLEYEKYRRGLKILEALTVPPTDEVKVILPYWGDDTGVVEPGVRRIDDNRVVFMGKLYAGPKEQIDILDQAQMIEQTNRIRY